MAHLKVSAYRIVSCLITFYLVSAQNLKNTTIILKILVSLVRFRLWAVSFLRFAEIGGLVLMFTHVRVDGIFELRPCVITK